MRNAKRGITPVAPDQPVAVPVSFQRRVSLLRASVALGWRVNLNVIRLEHKLQ